VTLRGSPVQISPFELTGPRVRLAPMQPSHAAGLYEAGRASEIWAYMPMQIRTPDDMRRLIEEALRAQGAGQELPFVIIDRETERIVGSTRLMDISVAHRGVEIGWTWLSPAAQRTRINTECKYLLLRHCFETLNVLRVTLKTDLRNVRSQQAIERLGAVREGVLRRHRILSDGYVRDSVYYSIIAEEWPAIKARFEEWLQ